MKLDISLIKNVFAYIKPYRGLFWFTFLVTLILSFLAPVRPEIIKHGINNYIAKMDAEGLLYILCLYILFLLIELAAQFVRSYWSVILAQNIMIDLRRDVYKKIQNFSITYFDKTPVGILVTRIISDIEGVAQIFSESSIVILGDLLKIIFIIAWMMHEDWQLSLWIMIPIPFFYWVTKIFKKSVNASFTEVRNQVARMNSFVQEHLSGMLIIQVFNREKQEQIKFEKINKSHETANIRAIFAYSLFYPVVDLLSAMSMGFLIFYGLNAVKTDTLAANDLGKLMQFIFYINLLYKPISQLADRFNVLQMGIVNADRVFKLLQQNEHLVNEGSIENVALSGTIEFKNVWFSYNPPKNGEYEWVLKDFNLRISPGEKIAIIGETGAGKSTIIQLLNRFYDFQEGDILLDGVSIRKYSLNCLRKNIITVLQDVFLFSDSIYNNVTFGEQDRIPLEEVIAAAKLIQAHSFIEKLPQAYHFNVQERGQSLSIGQRQLLSFLRAYLFKPNILILDEATSSLDLESEKKIGRATALLCEKQTSIVIAHRLSTIRHADKIIVLEKGMIKEIGNHATLLSNKGKYKQLIDAQFKKDLTEMNEIEHI